MPVGSTAPSTMASSSIGKGSMADTGERATVGEPAGDQFVGPRLSLGARLLAGSEGRVVGVLAVEPQTSLAGRMANELGVGRGSHRSLSGYDVRRGRLPAPTETSSREWLRPGFLRAGA
jgi:hypothetical protein